MYVCMYVCMYTHGTYTLAGKKSIGPSVWACSLPKDATKLTIYGVGTSPKARP